VDQLTDEVDGISAERGAVVPPLAENGFGVADGRPPQGELDVVPGGCEPVDLGQRLTLGVAPMSYVVAPPVAEIDAAEKGDVVLGPSAVTEHDQLLVMRPQDADPHVQ
jgi:hypothetical protein